MCQPGVNDSEHRLSSTWRSYGRHRHVDSQEDLPTFDETLTQKGHGCLVICHSPALRPPYKRACRHVLVVRSRQCQSRHSLPVSELCESFPWCTSYYAAAVWTLSCQTVCNPPEASIISNIRPSHRSLFRRLLTKCSKVLCGIQITDHYQLCVIWPSENFSTDLTVLGRR